MPCCPAPESSLFSFSYSPLKKHILTYYQQTLPNLLYGENYINSLQQKIMDLAVDRTDTMPVRDFVTTRKMQTLFRLAVYNFSLNIDSYNTALKQIKEIITRIDNGTKT